MENAYKEIEKKPFEGFNEEEAKLFVGKNSDYYLDKWKSSKAPDKKSGWNWASCLCGTFWLGYRKMYSIILYFLCAFIVIDVTQLFIKFNFNRGFSLASSIALGILGNTFYFNYMKKKIAKIKMNNQYSENLNQEIIKAGNGSWGGVGIAFLMMTGYAFLSYGIEVIITSII
ncbi:DUF2628 domain-containing protein [Clostridium bowmanii]|uniref:DUF2628 domain-containing protein n=1 Tax=Clostridium bowmanii TaxID=132925 RepID=UPI001C0BAC5E|nr:DUF2628 domain-containing protein [Clostridium bowmanii]MBU3189978.1 DUF2628 domain-containing protein [Clostridium bowmanii]MCA1074588.1 DUF2628 domain-containing protein [Clostridium bowmanii]